MNPPTTAPAGAFKIRNNTGIQSNRNLVPGFYYHTSTKEPIAAVRNIGNESPKKDQFKIPKRLNNQISNMMTSNERTTKAGTAWPSTR